MSMRTKEKLAGKGEEWTAGPYHLSGASPAVSPPPPVHIITSINARQVVSVKGFIHIYI